GVVGDPLPRAPFGIQRLANGSILKVELDDDRVGIEGRGDRARELSVELPPELRGQALRWRVVYERVLDTPVGAEGHAEVWDSVELGAGTLD
ncbi:hypothetical protein PPSIR1_08481, partial [Plesiocystis pacifica SIR-1]